MKKCYCVVIVVMLMYSYVNAQKTLDVIYSVKNAELISVANEKAILKANKTAVLFEEILSYSIPTKSGRYQVDEIINHIYKDKSINTMWSLEDTKRVVKEEMNLFQWSFTQEEDTVLNYRCRKAKTQFRGRTYEAWFTTELPFRAAPWKIHGLPGVVLRLEIDKDYYVLEGSGLKVEDSKSEIIMPFKDKKSTSWEDYVENYKKDRIVKERYYKFMN